MTPKTKAWKACSRYCRLRDALAYCKEHGIDLHQFSRPEDIIGACATCPAVKSWYLMDAGHFISRGAGGVSGVYFDERNVNLQCKRCNAFEQGAYAKYEKYMISDKRPEMPFVGLTFALAGNGEWLTGKSGMNDVNQSSKRFWVKGFKVIPDRSVIQAFFFNLRNQVRDCVCFVLDVTDCSKI